MRIFKKNTLTGVVGLTTTAVAALVLALPGTAQAAPAPAAWGVNCDKWAAAGDPGANDMVATIWRTSDSTKAARASFKGNGEKLSISNWSGTMMGYTLQWATANGSKIEKTWERDLGSGKSEEVNFSIPEGRTVYLSVGTPGGSTAYCTGKA